MRDRIEEFKGKGNIRQRHGLRKPCAKTESKDRPFDNTDHQMVAFNLPVIKVADIHDSPALFLLAKVRWGFAKDHFIRSKDHHGKDRKAEGRTQTQTDRLGQNERHKQKSRHKPDEGCTAIIQDIRPQDQSEGRAIGQQPAGVLALRKGLKASITQSHGQETGTGVINEVFARPHASAIDHEKHIESIDAAPDANPKEDARCLLQQEGLHAQIIANHHPKWNHRHEMELTEGQSQDVASHDAGDRTHRTGQRNEKSRKGQDQPQPRALRAPADHDESGQTIADYFKQRKRQGYAVDLVDPMKEEFADLRCPRRVLVIRAGGRDIQKQSQPEQDQNRSGQHRRFLVTVIHYLSSQGHKAAQFIRTQMGQGSLQIKVARVIGIDKDEAIAGYL